MEEGAGVALTEQDQMVKALKQQVKELQVRLEDMDERHVCKICYEREINTVLLDCKHAALCIR